MTSQPPLPDPVRERLAAWDLHADGALITTHSSWLTPVRRAGTPLMLKVARIDAEEAGYRLMSWWAGRGAARVLAEETGALLLERGLDRRDLASMARAGEDDEACRILCRTAAALHADRSEPPPRLHRLDDWFRPLFESAPSRQALAPAAEIARRLLDDPRDVRPLHGDLHHDNVLGFGERGWLAIDPHGLLGERAFDFANIFTNPDLSDPDKPLATLPGRLEARLAVVAPAANLEPRRLLSWIVAWTGLSAAWFLDDGDDQGAAIDLRINAIAARLLQA